MMSTIYNSSEGKANILKIYNSFQHRLGVTFEDRSVKTRFGQTHVLVTGPEKGMPIVVTHGGNSIAPQALGGLLPLIKLERYQIYAPDTIGHPGKSDQNRLSANDMSYGKWLFDVLDGLGLDTAFFIGGSYGAGILLRLAAYAPHRITKLALVVPSGIVTPPLQAMAFRITLPYLIYLLHPSRHNLIRAVRWMGNDIDDNALQLIEAVFQHVRVEAAMPRPVSKAELEKFTAPTMVIAAENDALFPGKAVANRAKQIFHNLVVSECLMMGTHYSSKRDLAYINTRLVEFLEASE
jgi:pimeloyl-ACP methyl ester carboxylesterase